MNATPRPWTLQDISESLNCLIDNRDEWSEQVKAQHISHLQTELKRVEVCYDALREALEVMKGEKEILAEKLAKLEKELAFYKAKNGDASVCHACDGTGWVYG